MLDALASQDADVSLYLHAELLPNIRQITLYVSLPGSPGFDGIRPEIQLSESRRAVTVSLPEPLDHVAETIKLPARVSDATRGSLKVNATAAKASRAGHPTNSSHDYSFRMQIDPSDEALRPKDEITDNCVPWTAADMSPSTRIRCRGCGTVFLQESGSRHESGQGYHRTQGWIWKDLPSGNWAEMMDFWHCHKPDPHEHDPKSEVAAALKIEEQTAQTKGYGASSRVEAIPGTVLIDVGTFLLPETDCVGLKRVRTLPCIACYCRDFPHKLSALLRMGNSEGGHFIPMLWPSILLP